MDMTIDQQVALDEALVPHASRLRIGKSNFHLRSDITSKESTLQVVCDVLRLTPFYKAFLVTADVPEIYMQEFWANAIVHHHSICFKMNNKKRIVNLKEIKKITDVNINKSHQPWRSFAAVINKCLSGKSTGYDSLRLSQAYFLWGMYHKKNVDFAYLLWEDFVYQVEHKDAKKSNEMYYPRNSAAYKEYYVIASGAAPPKTKANKVSHKRSLQQTHISQSSGSGIDEGTSIIPRVPNVPTDEFDAEIYWKSSDEDDDDEVDDRSDDEFHDDQEDADDQDDNDDDQDSDIDGDDLVHPKLSTHDEEAKDEESFDLIDQTPDEGPDAEDDNDELYRYLNINMEGREVQMTYVYTTQVFEDIHVTLTLVNPDGQQQSSSMSSQFISNMLNPSPDAGIDSLFESTPRVDVQVTTTVAPLPLTAPTRPPPSIPTISQVQQAPAPTPATSTLQDLPDFSSLFGFDHRLKNLEANFSEFVQTNQFAGAVSSILDVAMMADKDEEPFTRSDRRSKRRREGKETESISAPKEKASKTTEFETRAADDQPIAEVFQHPEWFQKQMKPLTPDRAWNKTLPATHGSIEPLISDLAKQADSRTSFNELMDTHVDFLAFLMNQLKVDTLTPELLAGPTYELMKGSCKSLVELEFFLEEVYKTWYLVQCKVKHWSAMINMLSGESLIEGANVNSSMDLRPNIYSKRRIIADTKLQIIERPNYKNLDWKTVRRDDDKLYKFKEGNLKRLHIQDIEDISRSELVDKPFGKSVIRLKWLWKNKKDEDQTGIHNKARLVPKGYAQEEDGRNGLLKEKVYVAQPDGFVDPDHLEKVYRLKKALYGLKQAPRAWYDELSKFLTSKGFTKGLQIHQSPRGIFINQAKYTLEILHKHGMEKGQSIGTPMATKPKLDADSSGNPVDQTDYRSKIRSLVYLTSSKPDIVQANCTAMSSAEAEYVALSASCAQVMWMRTQLQDYGFNYNKIPLYLKMEILLEPSATSTWKPEVNATELKPHSSKVGLINTCSCSNDKDILSIMIQESESSNSKTKTSANSNKQDLPLRNQVCQGRLLTTFQDDAKYDHGCQDTRSQGGKNDQDKWIKI
uniref:Reverse transcriptase Ty1/copia-type domain-containing protein n=1 Tax=Tanacetum cinerariifolium TaxID=118510 RepID=A0A6L2JMK4_TANCI|nr:hypothetical protein [Tanacetum cinerariifolium]